MTRYAAWRLGSRWGKANMESRDRMGHVGSISLKCLSKTEVAAGYVVSFQECPEDLTE